MKPIFSIVSTALLAMLATPAFADIIVDFTDVGPTNAGRNNQAPFNTGGDANNDRTFTFDAVTSPGQFVDLNSTGVTFTVLVTVPSGAPAAANLWRFATGFGNQQDGNNFFNTNEGLEFTISNVAGLAAGETLEFAGVVSQNPINTSADQSGGFGGTFGNNPGDSLTVTSDNGGSVVINSEDNSLGATHLNTNGNSATTGETFLHDNGNLTFTDSIVVTNTSNQGYVFSGLKFDVIPAPAAVPEPSSLAILGLGGLLGLAR